MKATFVLLLLCMVGPDGSATPVKDWGYFWVRPERIDAIANIPDRTGGTDCSAIYIRDNRTYVVGTAREILEKVHGASAD